jgi:predicted nucleic acid-binding Zn ribbon protein
MQRAVRLFQNSKLSKQLACDEDVARAIWPEAVGKVIAAHTSRVKLVRTTLVIEVEDAIWQRQLHTLTAQILRRIRKLTGSTFIEDLEFRIGIPRRQPQRVETLEKVAQTRADEADSIADPGMQRVYRMLRRRSSA